MLQRLMIVAQLRIDVEGGFVKVEIVRLAFREIDAGERTLDEVLRLAEVATLERDDGAFAPAETALP